MTMRLLDAIGSNARAALEARLGAETELRPVWQIIDLALATIRGHLRFGLLTDPRGYDAIDDYDCREWLLLNGASRGSVDSGYLRGLYDLGFSYEDGDPKRPRISVRSAGGSGAPVVVSATQTGGCVVLANAANSSALLVTNQSSG